MKDYSDKLEKLRAALENADSIIIGAGSGLSTAAGFEYSGARFEKYFSDFAKKYKITDMYSGGFSDFDSPEEFWAYWSRYIYINRYLDPPGKVYDELFGLVDGRDYFVITTNVDHCFQKAGFDKKRLFYTQGDYGLFQCGLPCCQKTYDNESAVKEMYARQAGMRIPSELLPVCPVCGRPMTMNLRADERFVEDEGWHAAAERYEKFVRTRARGRCVFFELGVGYNTPGIIKYPFWRMTSMNAAAVYACVNKGESCVPADISARSIALDADIAKVVADLGSAKK